jgi:hypothetical protein
LLYYLLWRDARSLARGEGVDAVLGQVWVTVTVIMGLGLVYKSVFSMTEIGYLFWLYSGIVVSRVVALRRRERTEQAEARSAGLRAQGSLSAGWLAGDRA